MSRSLALLRPEPGWSRTAAAARVAGLDVVGQPLFEARSVPWELPHGHFDALLVGSGAGFRHAGPQLAALRDLPVFAVGETTATAARAAGFTVARTGMRGMQLLLDEAAGRAIAFLRLAGEERVALAPHPGQTITERTVYRMEPRPVGPELECALRQANLVVALHSAIAARHFAQEVDRLGIARGSQSLLALAPRIAGDVGLGWGALHTADAPNDTALLAMAAALCK